MEQQKTLNNHSNPYVSEGNEIIFSKKYLHFCVHCSIIYNSQDMKTI